MIYPSDLNDKQWELMQELWNRLQHETLRMWRMWKDIF
jgi:hypothetical protein